MDSLIVIPTSSLPCPPDGAAMSHRTISCSLVNPFLMPQDAECQNPTTVTRKNNAKKPPARSAKKSSCADSKERATRPPEHLDPPAISNV
jgi:hypothetical protein